MDGEIEACRKSADKKQTENESGSSRVQRCNHDEMMNQQQRCHRVQPTWCNQT